MAREKGEVRTVNSLLLIKDLSLIELLSLRRAIRAGGFAPLFTVKSK